MTTREEINTYDLALEILEERGDGVYVLGDVRGSVGPSETIRFHKEDKKVTIVGYGSFRVGDSKIGKVVWPANNGARRLTSRSDWSKNRARITTLVSKITGERTQFAERKPATIQS